MTENDNIRHYIGDLEATKDIDVVFKHIYDLMLANGGEGSGLNADMLDGYHASDFAPASLKDTIDTCVNQIVIGGRSYYGPMASLEIFGTDIGDILYNTELSNEFNNVRASITNVEERASVLENSVANLDNISTFLDDEEIQNSFEALALNNFKVIEDENEEKHYYLDADSINGLSFQLVSQNTYDNLPNSVKLDPRNVFIINNDIDEAIDEGQYAPPSILQAGINLNFRVNTSTNNFEYTIDGGRTWKTLINLVGDEEYQGFLYPSQFALIKEAIDQDEDLQNQADYPFLLNTDDSKTQLAEDLQTLTGYNISGITIGSATVNPNSSNATIDVTNSLKTYNDSYMSSWTQNSTNINNLKNRFNLDATYEKQNNKASSISSPGSTTEYPSTKAIVDYISPVQSSLQSQINSLKQLLTMKTASTSAYTAFFNGTLYFRKIAGWVFVTGSAKTKTTVDYQGADDYWNFCDIPNGFEPHSTCRVVAQCSMTDRCFIYFNTDGYALIGRFDYLNKRTGTYTLPKDYWITMSTAYPAQTP